MRKTGKRNTLRACTAALSVTTEAAHVALTFDVEPRHLTALEPRQKFYQFFVSLNGLASSRPNGEPNFRPRVRNGSGRTMRGIEGI